MTAEAYNKMVDANEKRIKDTCIAFEGKYICPTCGSEIMAAQVIHPIWDGPFPQSGVGRCHTEYRPYCPICEEEPSSSGIPIAPKGSYHNP